jgi:hypothetical protein
MWRKRLNDKRFWTCRKPFPQITLSVGSVTLREGLLIIPSLRERELRKRLGTLVKS